MAKSSKKKGRKLLFTGIFLLLVAGGATGYFLRKREVVVPVQAEKATRRNLIETVVANGKIEPVVQVKISPEVSGEITELPVEEGQKVKKGDLLVKIKPDTYEANRRSEEARYKSAVANMELSEANLKKAELEWKRNEDLFKQGLISDSSSLEFQTAYEVARATCKSSEHQVEVAKAALARAEEELARTTIYSPLDGTVIKLNSEAGERVVGTAMMTGTEIMTVGDLNEMEARVDIGEMDVVLIQIGQKARLEVDAFRDRKFAGIVTEIANSSKTDTPSGGQSSQEATRFEVRVHLEEKAAFRPGMSVTADIETRYRTNVLTVPIQSVTTRLPADLSRGRTNAAPAVAAAPQEGADTKKKKTEPAKPIEVVFVVENDQVKAVPVKRGISDENYVEITAGLTEGEEVVSGGYKAISRDLQDGAKIKREAAEALRSKAKS
jgi:HlyD family secretion protein